MILEFIRKVVIRSKMRELRRTDPNTWLFADKFIPLLISRSEAEAARVIGMEMAKVPQMILERANGTRDMLEQFDWVLSEVESAEICHEIATAGDYDALCVAGIYRKYTCLITSNYRLGY